ncbi:MAG: hypothetical protein ACI97A_002549 [Planctomycetota bacterium]|jgi:hypothetical protein
MKTICIHQPDFAPWLGFFDRLIEADVYVVFDDAQFLRRGWHHRDKILGQSGSQWLTVPVLKKGRYEQEIREVEIDESTDWRRKHLSTLANVYGKRPGFTATHSALTEIYERRHARLIDLNMDIITWLLSEFHIDIEVCFASELNLSSRSTERLVDICRAHNAQNYLTGVGAKDYLQTDPFARHDITVEWQDFHHPEWNQGQTPFLSRLSALDALYQGASAIKMLNREEAG